MEELIQEGKNLIFIADIDQLKERYDIWCQKVKGFMKAEGFSKKDQDEFLLRAHYTNNEFFSEELQKSILNAIRNTAVFLDEVKQSSTIIISRDIALTIVERVLKNFYMYYQAMFKAPMHKSGQLVRETLGNIRIGNEYDLQRMVYSILLPIFPTIRQEVNSDNGYGGMRADIYLEDYSLIIETKCTRDSMSEKRLLDELGADIFHYKVKTVFILIFDKTGIIKNPVVFERAFKRDKDKYDKTVRLFITQATNW